MREKEWFRAGCISSTTLRTNQGEPRRDGRSNNARTGIPTQSFGRLVVRPWASLLLSHVSVRICSFVAPRPQPRSFTAIAHSIREWHTSNGGGSARVRPRRGAPEIGVVTREGSGPAVTREPYVAGIARMPRLVKLVASKSIFRPRPTSRGFCGPAPRTPRDFRLAAGKPRSGFPERGVPRSAKAGCGINHDNGLRHASLVNHWLRKARELATDDSSMCRRCCEPAGNIRGNRRRHRRFRTGWGW